MLLSDNTHQQKLCADLRPFSELLTLFNVAVILSQQPSTWNIIRRTFSSLTILEISFRFQQTYLSDSVVYAGSLARCDRTPVVFSRIQRRLAQWLLERSS